MRRALVLFFAAVSVVSCGSVPRKDSYAGMQIYRIDTGIANVYLVKAEKLIMVDTSIPDKFDLVVSKMAELGFKPEDLALIVVTHGHGDHAGNARAFQEKYKIPIAAGPGDLDKFTGGRTDLDKAVSIGVVARFIRGMSDKPYPAFTPDVLIKEELSLEKYGVPGKIVPFDGHTPGSLIVTLGDVAIVGDLIRGGMVLNSSPTEHFYHEKRDLAKERLRTLMGSGVQVIYPGHFGPLARKDVEAYLKD